MTSATSDTSATPDAANFYAVLGVDPAAGPQEVRAAYRRAALLAHPDKGGSPEGFKLLVRAFETISDEGLRAAYDRERRRTGGSNAAVAVGPEGGKADGATRSSPRGDGAKRRQTPQVPHPDPRANVKPPAAEPPEMSGPGLGGKPGSPARTRRRTQGAPMEDGSSDTGAASVWPQLGLDTTFEQLLHALKEMHPKQRRAAIDSLEEPVRAKLMRLVRTRKATRATSARVVPVVAEPDTPGSEEVSLSSSESPSESPGAQAVERREMLETVVVVVIGVASIALLGVAVLAFARTQN